jgi:hypothetical protein
MIDPFSTEAEDLILRLFDKLELTHRERVKALGNRTLLLKFHEYIKNEVKKKPQKVTFLKDHDWNGSHTWIAKLDPITLEVIETYSSVVKAANLNNITYSTFKAKLRRGIEHQFGAIYRPIEAIYYCNRCKEKKKPEEMNIRSIKKNVPYYHEFCLKCKGKTCKN